MANQKQPKQAAADNSFQTVGEVNEMYRKLQRALRFGALFALLAIVTVLAVQPQGYLAIAVVLIVVEVVGYLYFSKRYAQTRDELIADIEGGPEKPNRST